MALCVGEFAMSKKTTLPFIALIALSMKAFGQIRIGEIDAEARI
jgi:hypothetical protein